MVTWLSCIIAVPWRVARTCSESSAWILMFISMSEFAPRDPCWQELLWASISLAVDLRIVQRQLSCDHGLSKSAAFTQSFEVSGVLRPIADFCCAVIWSTMAWYCGGRPVYLTSYWTSHSPGLMFNGRCSSAAKRTATHTVKKPITGILFRIPSSTSFVHAD